MNEHLIKLAQRRTALVAQAAQQRAELAQVAATWRKPLALIDGGLRAVRYLRSQPLLVGGVILIAAIWRPRGMLGWIRRGWGMWRMVRAVKRSLSR